MWLRFQPPLLHLHLWQVINAWGYWDINNNLLSYTVAVRLACVAIVVYDGCPVGLYCYGSIPVYTRCTELCCRFKSCLWGHCLLYTFSWQMPIDISIPYPTARKNTSGIADTTGIDLYGAHKGTLNVVIFFISFVRNNISFVRNIISFVRNIISFVRNIISFVRNIISYVRNDFVCTKYYFVCTKYHFVCTKWFRLYEILFRLYEMISFARNIISFVRNIISFVRNNISFVRNITKYYFVCTKYYFVCTKYYFVCTKYYFVCTK